MSLQPRESRDSGTRNSALLLSAAILFVLCSLSAAATTYYVSFSTGNDSNSGTSNTTAWKTVDKVGDMWGSLNPGDTVLFKRGETWWLSDTWYVKGGNATHRMTYGSYGTGAQPVLKGSPLITNWTLYSGSIYRTTVVAEWGLSQIFIDGTFGDRRGGGVSNVTNNYDWYWENNTLYLYDTSGDPDNRTSPGVEATLFGVIGFSSNTNFANLTISQGGDGIGGWETSNLTLTNMTIEWNWCNGFAVNSGIDYGNFIVQDSIARYNGCSGIGFAIVNNTGSNFTVRRNTVYGNGKYQGTWDYYQTWSTGIKFWGPTGLNDIVIEDNECYDNSDRGADIWLDFASPTDPSHANIIRNNLVHDGMGIGIFMESTGDTRVYNNIIYDNDKGGDWGVFTNGGIKIDAREGTPSNRNQVYNNIVVGGYNGMFLATYSQWQGNLMMNNSVRNNIFINNSAAALQTIDGPNNDGYYGSGNVYEYNTFGGARSGIVRWDYTEYDTYAAWETVYCGSTNCSHSMQQEPLFVDKVGHDYHHNASSLAIDAGMNVNVTTDYDGNTRPKGAGYDLGPYEYGPTGNVPPTTPTPEINSTTGTNFSDQDVNCYDTLIDGNGDRMNVSVRWYRNGALNLSLDYNSSYVDLYSFVSTLGHGNLSVGENWSCAMSVSDGTNQTAWASTGNLTVRTVTYNPPTTPSPNINSADGTNYSNQSINCYDTLNDPDANRMNVSVRWYRNGALNRTVDYNNSYASGYSFVGSLSSGNLTAGENWSCGMRLTDPWNQSAWGNSANITIRYNPAPPSMTSLTLNATDSPLNSTNANLTATPQGLSEVNGDPVNLIFDWRLNGTSIALVNMNFDVVNSAGSGKTRDFTTYNHTGTVSAMTWDATGGRNGSGAYENTGYNGITIPNNPSLNFSTITVAIWYKSHPHTNSYGIFGKQDWTGSAWSGLGRIMLMNDNTTQFEFHTADGWNYLNSAKVPNDVWIHYVATYNGSRATIYINGAVNATTTANGPLVDNYISDLGFGGIDGVIDEIQIFNRSLSATQVKALYENKTNILVSNETSVGNNWSVCATPNNMLFDGNTTCSNSVVITNGTPSNNSPVISAVQNSSITNQSAVILWLTDISANSTVKYGTTLALLNSSSNTSFGTNHSASLTGLVNNTLYYYNISACNSYGNCSSNGTYNFTTLQNSNPAPVISSVQNTSITNQSAVITWSTDVGANESMRYGVTVALNTSKTNVSFGLNHSVTLTGLVNNTLYYYNITACDSYGNCTTNGTFSFTTLQNPTPAPVISSVQNGSVTNQSAIITWITDLAANESVRYGTTLALASSSSNTSFGTSHSMMLSGLTNNTRYYYNITACNSYGNCSTNGTFNFTTSQNTASTTYYVDATGGNDSNDGLSNSTPWRTIDKVNGRSFSPGDQILFKRGGTWRERLTVPSSGNATDQLVFGAYGNGAKPIISGANNITAESWTLSAANIYYTTVLSTDPTVVWLDGASYPEAASSALVNSTNRWFWSGGDARLYLYATSNPNGFYDDIEAPVRPNAVSSYNRAYVTYENLEMRYGSDTTMYLNGASSHAIIQDCTITGAGYQGALRIKEASNNCTVQRCTIVGDNRAGVDTVLIADNDGSTSGTIIQNCTIKNGKHSTLKLMNAASSLIQNNIIKNDNNYFGRALEVLNVAGVGGNIVRYNWIEGAYIAAGGAADGNKFFGDGNELYYNMFTTGDDVGLGMATHSESGLDYVCINNKVYNNVIYGFGKAGLKLWANLRNPSGNLIKNNIIFANDNDDHYQIEFGALANTTGFTFVNNTIYDSATNSTVYQGAARTVAYMQSNDPTHWSANLISDPKVTNAAGGNFTLQANSPCVNAGTNVSLTSDFAGTVVPQGSAPDMGAYEFISVNETPVQPPYRGGGGGGGGGGAPPAGRCPAGGQSTAHYFDRLSPGQRYTLRAVGDAYLIRNVTFSVSSEVLNGGTFTLSSTVNLSCENVSRVGPDYAALGYERIEYPGILPQQITTVAITFVVPLARITAAGGSPEGVSLLRYDGAVWKRLPTSFLGTSGGVATYAATSPGLSIFAVALLAPKPRLATPTNASTNLSTLSNGSGMPGAGSVGVNESGATPSSTAGAGFLMSKSSFWVVSVFFVLVVGGLLAGYFYYRRRRHAAHAALTEAYSQAAVGQPAALTDEVEVALEKLRAFITRELARGHTKAQIRAVLLKAGWQAKVVDRELAASQPSFGSESG